MAGCLECGEYITNPHDWVCDKCTEKFIKISERLGGNEVLNIKGRSKMSKIVLCLNIESHLLNMKEVVPC